VAGTDGAAQCPEPQRPERQRPERQRPERQRPERPIPDSPEDEYGGLAPIQRARANGILDAVTTMTPSGQPLAADATWWARALTLAERTAAGGRTGRRGTPTERDRRRLERWRAAHDLGARGQFGHRLAAVDLDETTLLALLAEPPAALAARTAPPEWAAFVEHALQRVNPSGRVPDGELTWYAGFTAIVAPFVAAAADRLEGAATGAGAAAVADLAAVRRGFAEYLTDLLVRRAARTLVLELNVLRVTERLAGGTPQQRFAAFVERMTGRDGLGALLGEYAVLSRLIGQSCLNAADAYAELLVRLVADREALAGEVLGGADPGPLVAVDVRGDGHRHGRSVALLRFAGGARVAYKPRPVTIHARFNELVRWLETRTSGLRLRTLAVLDRGEYGWVEFAQHRPCADDDEVAEFYRRLGALLALLYALDGTDVHCENLVACGDQPVLVDLETLLHPTLPATGPAADDPAAAALASSVDRITLLPRLLVGEHGALDVSGLGGDPDVRHPFDVVAWQADGTDEMRLVRRPTRFTGAENRPVNGDGEVDPGAYVEVLLSGFRAGYDAIVAHGADLLGPGGLLARCAEDRTRMVPRATRTYATLLDESTHPDLMRDALDRDRILDALWASSIGDDVRHRLVRHEIADLWEGDVPLFLARPGSRDLWTGDGERLAGLLAEPSLARVVRKISGMGELDRYDQEWIIRASMATRATADAHDAKRLVLGAGPAVLPDPDRLLAAARAIADQLVARAYRDGGRVNWLGLEALEGRHWMVRPLGAGFAHGYTGVALFLAQISALTGAPGYAECARDAVSPVPKLLAGIAAEPLAPALVGCGGFEGLGGVAYGLSRLAVLLGDAEIAGWVVQAVDLTAAASAAAEHDGVAEGLAGCVAAMLAVHQATGLPAAWQTASRCAQRLAGSDSMPVDHIPVDHMAVDHMAAGRGFANGADGLGWALRRFAMAGGGECFARAGAAILDRANGAAMLDRANGAAMPDGWCRGLAGRVLARVGEPTARHARLGLDAMLGGAPLANHSLCHGELGNLEPLIVAASRGDRSAATSLGARTAQVLGAIERYGARCGTPGGVDSPGLLTGLAGIGYGLLRVGFAGRVPSVLLLEPDRV